MNATEAVRLRILEIGSVTAILQANQPSPPVDEKVYSVIFPQSLNPPAVRVQTISEIEQSHLRGAGGPYSTRVQVDAVAASYAQAVALDAAIHGDGAGSGLSGFQGAIGSPPFQIAFIEPDLLREMYDAEELRQFRVSRDYWVHHQ